MDELFEKSLLYDFYGELLTEHQKSVYERFVFEDMSLAEVAEDEGISRQGVHDLVKRCDKILQDYEKKLHLVEKFVSIKKKASEMRLSEIKLIVHHQKRFMSPRMAILYSTSPSRTAYLCRMSMLFGKLSITSIAIC